MMFPSAPAAACPAFDKPHSIPTKGLSVLAAALLFCHTVAAGVILDDTWADGTRTNQSLPTHSAWFTSSASALTASMNAMTLAMGGSAILNVTYFGTNSSSPVPLEIGDTLVATLRFSFSGVAPANSSLGFRLGIFNFADSTLSPRWATSDGLGGSGGLGTGVQGYALFQNFGVLFDNASPMDLRKRTTVSDISLLGTSGDYTSLVTGPANTNGFPGFPNGTACVLQWSLHRSNSTTLVLSASWQNLSSGATLSVSVADTNAANFRFDGLALRPQTASQSATNIIFQEVKVELNPGGASPEIVAQPDDQSVYAGQTTTFGVTAGGSAPLRYQWFFNTNTAVAGATNATLSISNAQPAHAGAYSVRVTNVFGSATSDEARLVVTVPVAPVIVSNPVSRSVLPGATVSLNVIAGGTEPLMYQWMFNTNTPIANATDAILSLTNFQSGNAGSYGVIVSNVAGSVTSAPAFLTLNLTPVAPSFTAQPVSQVVLAGGAAGFSAQVTGTAPLRFQWRKNGGALPGATNTSFTLPNVQTNDAGTYTLAVSNSVGSVTSDPVTLIVTTAISVPASACNLTGFGRATTGGGVIAETNAAYRKVYTALDLANAILAANKTAGAVKVIEIMNDLDLGWNEVGTDVQSLASTPFRQHATPLLHPRLLVTGVSLIDIKPKGGLTFFSANGATIRHATFNVKSCGNIIIRNLKFDEMWEWDESSKGKYDRNDWDFIDLGNGGTVSNVWVDHCTFTKAYDGISDIKGGSFNITYSWCKYTGDDGATNLDSWVWQQIHSLESDKTSHAMYDFLRNNGFSMLDIVTIIQGQDKTHLMGATELTAENADLSATFHHNWFINPWDRLPRLRAGNVHNYNIYVDATTGQAARRLRDARAAAMSTANQNTLNNTYSFRPFLNGSISTENGAVLVEKSVYAGCLTPLRNNQTDPSDPTYTGKILALDTIYQMDDTLVRGNSTDTGNPLGPFQAAIIPFSWNLPGGQLPYSYTMDDPAQLPAILTNRLAGAGAGILTWDKTNWMATSYPVTPPTILAQPVSQSVAAGSTATFTLVAGGSAPLQYRWFFNTNTVIAGATNSSLVLTNARSADVGRYFAIVTNSAGSVTSSIVSLTLSAVTRPTLSAAWDGQQFVLSVAGDSGPACLVQTSTNLETWTPVYTNADGPPFQWGSASNGPRCFYRVKLMDSQ